MNMRRSFFPQQNPRNPEKAGKFALRAAACAALCVGAMACARAQNSPSNGANQSSSSNSEISGTSVNPSRTTESHETIGNMRVDKQHVEVLGPNGHYQPYSETETETTEASAGTMRTVVRTYTFDSDGRRTLARMTEENAEKSASGEGHVVRTTSDSDLDGRLHVSQRQVEDTKNTSGDTQQVQTTTYLGDGNGGFTPYLKTDEVQSRGAAHVTKVDTTTSQPDADGKWRVSSVKETTIQEDGNTKTSDERLSTTDVNGKISQVAHTVSKQTKDAAGGQTTTVDTYAPGVPGYTRDTAFPLVRRVTTVEKNNGGEKTTEQRTEQPDPNRANYDLQVMSEESESVRSADGGTQGTKTYKVKDINGSFNVTAVQNGNTVRAFTPAAAPASQSSQPSQTSQSSQASQSSQSSQAGPSNSPKQ